MSIEIFRVQIKKIIIEIIIKANSQLLLKLLLKLNLTRRSSYRQVRLLCTCILVSGTSPTLSTYFPVMISSAGLD